MSLLDKISGDLNLYIGGSVSEQPPKFQMQNLDHLTPSPGCSPFAASKPSATAASRMYFLS